MNPEAIELYLSFGLFNITTVFFGLALYDFVLWLFSLRKSDKEDQS